MATWLAAVALAAAAAQSDGLADPLAPRAAAIRDLSISSAGAQVVVSFRLEHAFGPEIDRRLGNRDYLCGAFSAADIAMFMPIHYARRLGGPPLKPHAALRAWYHRLAERPSFAGILAEIAAADRALSLPVEGAFKD